MTLDKMLVPAPDGHPAVFDREWPLRVADIDRNGRFGWTLPRVISRMSARTTCTSWVSTIPSAVGRAP